MLSLIEVISTFFLTGLIWTVQVVHYPGFVFVDPKRTVAHSQFHQRAMTWIVMPPMLVELFCSGLLWFENMQNPLRFTSLFLVILIWLSTFFLSVPLHARLARGEGDLKTVKRLVLTNWPRTFLWTLRSVLLTYLVVSHGYS